MFIYIFSQLKNKGINVLPRSLKKYHFQGLMSSVYVINSDRGKLIIHIINPVKEWKRQKIWEKLSGVASLLTNFLEIPTARLFLSGKFKNKYFLVQEKLNGQTAGKRILVENEVSDIWFGKNKNLYLRNLQEKIAVIHKIKFQKCGWPIVKNNKIVGQYKSWRIFLKNEIPLWLQSVKEGDSRLKNREDIKLSFIGLDKLTGRITKQIPQVPSVLIHGDAINPSNILVKNSKISGILDWEWSIIGDPAWEFCDPGWWPLLNEKSLKTYIKAMAYPKSDFKVFLKRAKMYRVLWLLWGSHMHAKDKNIKIYKVLREMLLNETAKLRSTF